MEFTPINPPLNLDDPHVLAVKCRELADGMDQQSTSSQSGTALAGHPSPGYFYGDVARTLRLAADKMDKTPVTAPRNDDPKPTVAPEPKPQPQVKKSA